MAGKVERRKAALRERLIEAAEARIVSDGMRALRARDLAKEAGCAVGAIYNVFDDMTALVLAVNGRTFVKLGRRVTEAIKAAEGEGPRDRLIAMSLAYMRFASENKTLWHALFDLEMARHGPVPRWYLEALDGLFAHIAGPVGEIFADMDHVGQDLMVRALFSSVHGIVLLGIEQRISGVPLENVEQMIAQMLKGVGRA